MYRLNLVQFIGDLKEKSPKSYKRLLSKIKDDIFEQTMFEYTSFLDETVTRSNRLFHIASLKRSIPMCPICEVNHLKFKDFSSGYTKFCSGSCEIKNKWLKTTIEQKSTLYDKQRATNLERYGNENSFKSEIVKENIRKSFTEKYGEGVTNPSHIKEFRDKANESIFKKHGVRNAGQTENAINSRIERYGCENPFSSNEIKDKIKKTNIERYGAEHPLQNREIFDKAMKHRSYTYLASNDKEYVLQGYEKFAIEKLLKMYNEADIISGRKIPSIPYIENDKSRKYFPDFYIKSENLIIEVKSLFIYEREIVRNELKKNASINIGYKFEFWIFDGTGTLTEIK